MWSPALTNLASVIHHVGLIQLPFSTAANVSCVFEKKSPCFGIMKKVTSVTGDKTLGPFCIMYAGYEKT